MNKRNYFRFSCKLDEKQLSTGPQKNVMFSVCAKFKAYIVCVLCHVIAAISNTGHPMSRLPPV